MRLHVASQLPQQGPHHGGARIAPQHLVVQTVQDFDQRLVLVVQARDTHAQLLRPNHDAHESPPAVMDRLAFINRPTFPFS